VGAGRGLFLYVVVRIYFEVSGRKAPTCTRAVMRQRVAGLTETETRVCAVGVLTAFRPTAVVPSRRALVHVCTPTPHVSHSQSAR